VRRFCAESSVRLLDGSRLTSTNAIQAGEMHYKEGGASPYHMHKGTDANPDGWAGRWIGRRLGVTSGGNVAGIPG